MDTLLPWLEFARTRHLIIIYPVGLVVWSSTKLEFFFVSPVIDGTLAGSLCRKGDNLLTFSRLNKLSTRGPGILGQFG